MNFQDRVLQDEMTHRTEATTIGIATTPKTVATTIWIVKGKQISETEVKGYHVNTVIKKPY